MLISGLPGLKGAFELDGLFTSVTDGIRGLRKARVKSTAGDFGAINIWVDDAGKYRGERTVHMVVRSRIECRTLGELRAWLREEFPKIGR